MSVLKRQQPVKAGRCGGRRGWMLAWVGCLALAVQTVRAEAPVDTPPPDGTSDPAGGDPGGAPAAAPPVGPTAAPPAGAPSQPGSDQAPDGAEQPGSADTVAQELEQARQTARDAYAEGTALYARGQYAEAKAAFERAYTAVPNPIVLLPIAEAELKLEDTPAAISTLERYLRERPDAPDRSEIGARVARLKAMPATIVVASDVPGLRVTLDRIRVEVPSLPLELKVPSGEHTLDVTADGYQAVTHTVTAEPGGRHTFTPDLVKEPEPEPAPVAAVEPPEPVEDASTAIWVTGIVGATGLVAGSVLGFMALSENSDFDSDPSAGSADRGERLALFADVAFGVGAMALVTGAVLYLTEGEGPSEEEARTRRNFDVAAVASPDGAFVSTTIRY